MEKLLFYKLVLFPNGKLESNSQAVKLLEQVLNSAQQIADSPDKVSVLRDIIPTQVKLNLWLQAHHTVSQCPSDECKVESLAHILTAWAEKKNPALKEEE